MTTEEDDEEGFGDFTFAPSAVNSNSKTNGWDLTVNDDDDWGDFVKSPTLSRSESLPAKSSGGDKSIDLFSFFIDRPNDASKQNDVAVPDSAPSRTPWMKPKGALPLSIFGEAEKVEEEVVEEKASPVGVLFNAATKVKIEKKSSLNVRDFFSDLYKQTDQSKTEKESELNLGNLSLDGLNSESNGSDLERSVSKLDSNGLNWVVGRDDGWQFKGAETKQPDGDSNIKSDLQVKAENAPKPNLDVFNSSWGLLSPDLNGASSNFNGNLNANWSSSLVDEIEDFGDDDGWEFKVADSETRTGDGDSKVTSKAVDNPEGVNSAFGLGNSANVPTGLFVPSYETSQKSGGLDFGFDFGQSSVTPKGISSNSFSDSKQKDDNKNGLISTPVDGNVDMISLKSGGLDFGFNFGTSSVTPNGISSNSFSDSKHKDDGKNGQNPAPVKGNVDGDLFGAPDGIPQKSGGLDFAFDFSTSSVTSNGTRSNSFSDSKQKDDHENGQNPALVKGNVDGDLFGAPEGVSAKSGGLDLDFDYSTSSVTPNGISSNSFSDSKQKDDNKIGLNSTPVTGNADNGENFWAFKDAFSETGSKNKGNEVKMENHRGALPLSFFGDGENETHDPLDYQDALPSNTAPSIKESPKKSFGSSIPINDLISSLYSQAEQNTSVNHTQSPSDKNLGSTQDVDDSDLIDGDGDFDDDSWEFKAAFSGTAGENQISNPAHGDLHVKYSTKVEQKDYEGFYSKLKDELFLVAQCHLDNLKKTQSATGLGDGDAEVKALDKEVQDLYNELQQDSIISREPHSENYLPSNICLDKFVEVLQDPVFHAFESEYHLSERLKLAEKDWRLAIQLLKHTASTLKILTLGSREEQSKYVSAWCRMLSVCAQELRHGVSIWKELSQKHVQSQILSDSRGKQYVLALGEIHRVAEVLGSSAKLYKPWVLLSCADPTGMFTLLNECSNLWSSSGLEEAFQSISDPTGLHYSGTPKELLESVKFIHNLDNFSLHNHVFSEKEPTCRLSLLTAGTVPGLKMVVWSGENCFLTLANLWANLVSNDLPNLPHIHFG